MKLQYRNSKDCPECGKSIVVRFSCGDCLEKSVLVCVNEDCENVRPCKCDNWLDIVEERSRLIDQFGHLHDDWEPSGDSTVTIREVQVDNGMRKEIFIPA